LSVLLFIVCLPRLHSKIRLPLPKIR
jgi:hypothetical protein